MIVTTDVRQLRTMLNKKLVRLNSIIEDAMRLKVDLQNQCLQHEVRPLVDGESASIQAVCVVCDKDLGWRCVSSLDSICHYPSEVVAKYVFFHDGTSEKLGSNMINTPIDTCMYCRQKKVRS